MAFNMLANVLVHSLVHSLNQDANQRLFLMLLHILVQILVLILSHMLNHTLNEAPFDHCAGHHLSFPRGVLYPASVRSRANSARLGGSKGSPGFSWVCARSIFVSIICK